MVETIFRIKFFRLEQKVLSLDHFNQCECENFLNFRLLINRTFCMIDD